MSKSDTGNIVSRQTSRTDFHQGEHDEEEEEELDPRIQIELEKLNSSTDVINKLEIDLEEARATFRSLLSDSGQQLSRLSRQLGSCVDHSRPYYEARMRSRHALIEAQRAAARFEKASSQHEAAKEMVLLAEEGYIERGMPFDQAWQEMLNHSTTRVNDSEIERNLSAEEHRAKSQAYQTAEARVLDLQRNLKRSINKSRPYFEIKARFNQTLDDQKRQVHLIEETIVMTKQGYADSLRELEKISEEIHERRKMRKQLGVREAGVGAECPPPSPKHEAEISKLKLSEQQSLAKQRHSSKAQTDLKEDKSMTTKETATTTAIPAITKDPHKVNVKPTNFVQSPDFFIDPLMVRVQPVGAVSSLSLDLRQGSNPSSGLNTQPPPLPPRKFIPSKIMSEERFSLSSSSASTASTSRSSSLKSPSYEQLADSPPFKPPPFYSNDETPKLTLTDEKTPTDDFCDASLSDGDDCATPSKRRYQPFEVVTPNRLQLPCIRRVAADDDDISDTDSMASMEMLDDDQIEQLMKEMSLQNLPHQ